VPGIEEPEVWKPIARGKAKAALTRSLVLVRSSKRIAKAVVWLFARNRSPGPSPLGLGEGAFYQRLRILSAKRARGSFGRQLARRLPALREVLLP
jgi:hypothetical protein